jgi:hypothetical protein
VGFSIIFSNLRSGNAVFNSLSTNWKLLIFSEAIPRALFSYVEIVISGLRLYNFSFIDVWSPLPIEIADSETNTPRKT